MSEKTVDFDHTTFRLVTVHKLEAIIQDEIVDLTLQNVADKFRDAENTDLKARINALAQLDAATFDNCNLSCTI